MPDSPFANLPIFGSDIIYADPPWGFDNWSEKGEARNPNQHYDTMPWEEIAALPVGELASRNCACFLWAIDPLRSRRRARRDIVHLTVPEPLGKRAKRRARARAKARK